MMIRRLVIILALISAMIMGVAATAAADCASVICMEQLAEPQS